jgi:hypothetical protein
VSHPGPVDPMKDKYFTYYEKLMNMTGQWTITDTYAYKSLSTRYPHIAESIRLEKEKARLIGERASSKDESARGRLSAEIRNIEANLREQSLLKHLHREKVQETKYRIRYAMARIHRGERIQDRIRFLLPPTLQDLKSLDQTDRALALKQWIKRK